MTGAQVMEQLRPWLTGAIILPLPGTILRGD